MSVDGAYDLHNLPGMEALGANAHAETDTMFGGRGTDRRAVVRVEDDGSISSPNVTDKNTAVE